MQNSKVIDVTRSFIPVNVNSYPENLHATDREDSPEKRVPVVPYAGHNFMPTAYGYRSYFGTNDSLDVTSLSPNKVNEILLYQTANYKNIFIALCDTGIWACNGSVQGVWTQLVVKAAPAEDVFFEYTYCVINNKLYVFRSNDTAFYEITTDLAAALFISVTAKVPAFITAASQLGMFRLGARLGFWDGANAIAWSSTDDYTAFTPAVLTGANVTTFNSVIGKISAIRPHGKGAMVYATKSVVFLSVEANETFLVKAHPVLNNAGVAYLRQSVECVPDTLHFCITNAGIYKIQNGAEEVIVPEVWDYLQEFSNTPIYLKQLQGRHLFFETMDPDVIAGGAQFSEGVIPASTLTFPALNASLDAINASTPASVNICDVMGLLDQGYFSEQKAQADAAVPPALRKPGTVASPRYTCYISNNGVKDADNITFDNTPCGFVGPNGTPFLMSPSVPMAADLTNTSVGKTVSTGAQAYIDGKWTMERFVQAQSAIWKAEEKAIDAALAKILAQAYSETKVSNEAACAVSGPTIVDCALGRLPTDFSDYKFGLNPCSFWLTRYAIGATELIARKTTTISCASSAQLITSAPTNYLDTADFGTAASPDSSVAAVVTRVNGYNWGFVKPYTYEYPANGTIIPAVATVTRNGVLYAYSNMGGRFLDANGAELPQGGMTAYWAIPAGYSVTSGSSGVYPGWPNFTQTPTGLPFIKTETIGARNVGIPDPAFGVVPETAYCELTHWAYTDVNGVEQIVAAAACTLTADKYPGSTTPVRVVPLAEDRPDADADTGSFCGLPYEPGLQFPTPWTDQSVTYPESKFLLQVGSIAPKYPTMEGAFVYDLHLKKWGKMLGQYKQLLDYSPFNTSSADVINFDIFGMLGGVVKADGLVYIFTDKPADSKITWGKIGYYRAGMTDAEEIRVDFRKLSTGTLIVQASIDGKNLGDELITTEVFTSTNQVIAYPAYAGKWHNFTVTGNYDICYAEFKGLIKGRR